MLKAWYQIKLNNDPIQSGFRRLRAGALYYAILVSFLVTLLTGFLMINIWFHHQHTMYLLQIQRMDRNLNSALVLAKETPNSFLINQSKSIDLYENDEDEVKISLQSWGGFCIIKAETVWQKVNRSVVQMCGADIFVDEPVALYLADKEKHLSLCGSTRLNGNCYVPRLGIRRGNIEGQSYNGDELVHGEMKTSKPYLPPIDPSFLASNKDYLAGDLLSADSVVNLIQLNKLDTIENSFYNKTIVFHASQWLTLANKYLKGNIRIVSTKGVTLKNSSHIYDIIVYAPKIEIESGFKGSLQLFATDTIIIHQRTSLLFPSLVALMESQIKRPFIQIEKECKISGDIFSYASQNSEESQMDCLIDKGSVVNGRIYCDGKLQLKGLVKGSVYCNSFILSTPASLYVNHLLDVTIDFKALSKYYSGSCIFNTPDRYKTIKWIY